VTAVVPAPAAATRDGVGARRAEELAELPLVDSSPRYGLFTGVGRSLSDVWRYRSLLDLLFRRELKVRYKDSTLGFFWTLIRPLMQLLVYAVAIGKFLGASNGLDDYPIYVFSGLTIWTLFSEILSAGTGSLLTNGGLIKKLYLPREVFPLATVASAMFNASTQIVILVAGTFALDSYIKPGRVGYALLAVAIVLTWGTALALVLGAVNVYLRDTQFLVEIFLLWGLWTAPVVYQYRQASTEIVKHGQWLLDIYLANPITEAVLGFHRGLWSKEDPANTISDLLPHMLIVLAVGMVLLVVAQRVFSRLQANFAQEL
jgi:ABC-2 type transport system permease protein